MNYIIIFLMLLVIGLVIYLIISSNTEEYSPLDSQIDNSDIFVICKNYDSNVINKFNKTNLNYKIIKQINSNTIDIKKLVSQGVIKVRNVLLSKTDYALFLTNINIWQIFLKSDKNFCVVMTSDTATDNTFKETLKKNIDKLVNIFEGFIISPNSYILSRKAVEILINHSMPITCNLNNYFISVNRTSLSDGR